MVGIILTSQFVEQGDKAYQHYIDYIDRESAVSPFQFSDYALGYMDDPEKTSALFSMYSNKIENDEKKLVKEKFKEAEENNSLLWQMVVSFDNEWLSKNGLYDKTTTIVNEEKLKTYTRASMQEFLEKENLSTAYWTATVHHNTDNIHIHIAMVDLDPAWEEGKGRCFSINGELKQRGKFKNKSINSFKSKFAAQVIQEKSQSRKITELVRDVFLSKENDFAFEKDRELRKSFVELANKLPNDLSLLKYGNNVMKEFRPEIDELTLEFLNEYFKTDYEEFKKLVSEQEELYKEAYGGENDYYQKTMDDLYKRMGNQILKQVSEYKKKANRPSVKTARQRNFFSSSAFYDLKNSMKKDIQSLKNQAAYERMIREMENEI